MLTNLLAGLLAARPGQWFGVLVPVIVFIVYSLIYAINESRQTRKRQQQRKQAGASPNAPQRPRTANQPAASDEIEEFLRRAAQQRREETTRRETPAQAQPPRPQPGRAQPPRPAPPRAQPPRKAPQRETRPTPAASTQRPTPPVARRPSELPSTVFPEVARPARGGESLSDQTARRLSTDDVSLGASHLADDINKADLEREKHFQATFSHTLGRLASDDTDSSDERTKNFNRPEGAGGLAAGLAGLLRPESLRYAMLLHEVFTPPAGSLVIMTLTEVVPGRTRLGWIGTGVMGSSMCGHLLAAGFAVTVTSRTRSKAEPLLARGAHWAETPRAVAAASDVVFSIVGYPSDVREVLLGEHGALHGSKAGSVLVDMTTSQPSLAVEIFQRAAERNVHSVDAPVSGGDIGAREARLSIMIGGEEAVVAALGPCWQAMGKTIVRQGGPGAGQHAKMVNQILIASGMVGVCEALLYGYRAGLNLETVLQSVSSGAAGSWSLSNLGPRIIAGNFAPGFFVEHFIKDMGIALDEARRLGLALPGLALAQQLYLAVAAQGHQRSGTHALELALAQLSGIDWQRRG